jgi:hypothetical protein
VITADRITGITAGLDQVPMALSAVRHRVVDLGEGLDAGAWEGPSRCELWTAHDVLRHVRDCCRLHVGGLRRDGRSPLEEPFDNRLTPRRWLEQSTGEPPAATLEELRRLGAEETDALGHRLETPDGEVVPGPYGPIPWTLLTTHVFWDAWLHERDVAELVDGGLVSTPVEDAVVALYALFIASMVAVLRSHPFAVTVALAGTGRDYVAAVSPGHVELRVAASPPDADLGGELAAVVDALAGRGRVLADVLDGDTGKQEPLTWLGAAFRPAP